MNDNIIKMDWEELVLKISKKFNVLADFDFMLFLIGIQERGLGYKKYSKEEKMDMINLARCVLFTQKGYYTKIDQDVEGWPQFKVNASVDEMLPSEREAVLKEAMLSYFEEKL